MTPAVFLDRDGTLIEESGYLDRLDRLTLYPFATDSVRLLNRAGLAAVVVSNQSGIGRGLLTEGFVHEAHAHLVAVLAAGGARLDGFYYCPHHPEALLPQYRSACDCRKPLPGMLRQAAAALDIDLSRSFLVGDRWGDMAAAHAAGARGVLVRTGYGAVAESTPAPGLAADAVADNLAGAVAWILRQR